MPIVANGAMDDVVLLWGDMDQGREMIGRTNTPGAFDTIPVETACRIATNFVYQNLAGMPTGALSSAMGAIGLQMPSGPGVPVPDCENSGYNEEAWFIFTTCSMIMGSGDSWMRWTVPPLAPEAQMTFVDPSTNQGYTYNLETSLEAISENTPMALGNLRDIDISGPGASTPVTLDVSLDAGAFTTRQYTARNYTFGYVGEISAIGGASVGMLGQLGRIETSGDADIVADAPGADVIGQFYRNFRDNLVPPAGAASMFGGMMRQMAGLASQGIPVSVTQTNSGGVGLSSMMGGANVGVESESTSTIDRIMILPGAAGMNCGPTVFPEGMQVVDLGVQMAEASAQAAAAMGEMNEMLEGMSPEELAMLQQFGGAGGLGQMLGGAGAAGAAGGAGMTAEQQAAMQQVGGLLGGLLGGAGGMPGAAAAGATAGGAAPAAARPAGPSLSSALMTDDITQSAQNLLGALGYDTGNADGELSIETTIAISQFQAEQGLEVTGEVTPQLVGILAARVDAL
jgi:hypothetical protein